eukprot:CAMPEP_0172324120 /NCGR_PEP_ID=MMETSP1058-20130122/50523_1 /TAXON_ID=83371 /ORGANISM="Detonula confervacea, Strain CCMP 353" /LENGTH=37 /DNA_ID= /DNA_START= /DNA_END= /DNA_ORIENTATION=
MIEVAMASAPKSVEFSPVERVKVKTDQDRPYYTEAED